jgi:hypothetical protein
MKQIKPVLIFLLVMAVILAGCGKEKQAEEEDFFVPIAAYQFAKSEVQTRLPVPNSAVFPQFTAGGIEVEGLGDNLVEVRSYVSHRRDMTVEDVETVDFTVVLKYLGDGLYQLESLEFH